MSQVLNYDDPAARRIETLYRTPEVIDQRRRVLGLLAPCAGERLLDVGCGPGYLACEIASHVGSTGAVSAIDVSDAMLGLARKRTEPAPGAPIELHRADATVLPFADGTFDGAVATQVYEFVTDVTAALAELYRVLRPGGRALILDTDWATAVWHSSNHARSERVLKAWRNRLAHPHLPRELSARLRDAGFGIADRAPWTIFDPQGREDSYSHHQVDHIAASITAADESASAVVQPWATDLRALASSGEYFFSLNRYLFLATKPKAT